MREPSTLAEIARVESIGVDALVLEVFGGDAQGVALDASAEVFGDEDGAQAFAMQVVGDGDDFVVGGGFFDACWARVVGDVDADEAGFAAWACAEGTAAGGGELAPVDAVGEGTDLAEAVEVADGSAGVAAQVVILAFHFVQFFDDLEGDDDVVFLEDEHGVGVMQQDVGVEYEVLDGLCAGNVAGANGLAGGAGTAA